MKKFFRKFLRRKRTDRTQEYWSEAAKGSLEETMEKICDGFDRETFEEKKDSILFFLNVPLVPDAVVLDLACGIGRTCRWVAPKIRQYVGVDFIPQMIEKAREYNKEYTNARFYVNNGKTLDVFNDQMFDIVYCEIAFQHMTKPIQKSYVQEIYRVLKKRGLFYAQLPKMSFYNDDTYALTENEARDLLKNFKVIFFDVENPVYKAYYAFRAEKE